VVTSRVVLAAPGEVVMPLDPLPVDEAAALFVERATAASPGFVAGDPAVIQALVELLDGVPLAIELAAARARVVSPATLLAEMSARLPHQATQDGGPAWHATLTATLAWSWGLLSGDERRALAQLSVFDGGFTLEAAEAVLRPGALWPVDALHGLLDHSLVQRVDDDRLRLLWSVHEFASKKLDELGAREGAEARHGAYFARHGAALEGQARRHGGGAARRVLRQEVGNLSAAARRAAARGDGPVAVAAARAAWEVLGMVGPFVAALALARAIDQPGLDLGSQAWVVWLEATAARRCGELRASAAALSRALPAAVAAGDRLAEAQVRLSLADAFIYDGQPDAAMAELADTLRLSRALGDRVVELRAQLAVSKAWRVKGATKESLAAVDLALGLAVAVGDLRGQVIARITQGEFLFRGGRLERAVEVIERALAAAREMGDRYAEGIALNNLGFAHMERGALGEAALRFDAGLRLAQAIGDPRSEAVATNNQGSLARLRGDVAGARSRHEAALALYAQHPDARNEAYVWGCVGRCHADQGSMGLAEDCWAKALAAARATKDRPSEASWLLDVAEGALGRGATEEAFAAISAALVVVEGAGEELLMAKLLCARAKAELARGERGAASATWAAIDALSSPMGLGAGSDLARRVAAVRARLDGPRRGEPGSG
jgi:tetratricopeptide (TPR) repeat protein